MIWKKDKLKPTQPYFVFDTKSFYQEVYLKQGISHFYTFRLDNHQILKSVPDGCIDLFFEYRDAGMDSYVCGTPLAFQCEEIHGCNEVFGVRFMPGLQPDCLKITMKDVMEQRVPLKDVLRGDSDWLYQMEQETDFYQRIRIYIEAFTKAEKNTVKPYGKKELIHFVKQMVYDSDGTVKISEIQDKSGYTARYINKVFIDEMGFSPKTFCKIIQFQRALEFLNYGAPDKMTDAAVYLGYYDQPQFIRDFSRYAGTTPKKYLKLVKEYEYRDKVHMKEKEIQEIIEKSRIGKCS